MAFQRLLPFRDYIRFQEYEIGRGELWLKFNFYFGASGLEADIGLFVPPSDFRLEDAREGSSQRGKWDLWAFGRLLTMPSATDPACVSRWDNGLQHVIFFGELTTFDSPQKIIASWPIEDTRVAENLAAAVLFDCFEMEAEFLPRTVDTFMEIAKERARARALELEELALLPNSGAGISKN